MLLISSPPLFKISKASFRPIKQCVLFTNLWQAQINRFLWLGCEKASEQIKSKLQTKLKIVKIQSSISLLTLKSVQ